MSNEQPQFALKHFVEEIGLLFESLGLPRMAGRVLGRLLIADPPHQSMPDLVEALLASKASISNSTRLLLQMGFIERVSLPGHRRDYFRIKADAWYQIVREEIFKLSAFRQLAERGLMLVQDRDPQFKHRLAEMHDMCAFLEREMPLLLERWEQERQAKHALAP